MPVHFFWATEGLNESDCDFAPRDGTHRLGWMVKRTWELTNWIRRFTCEPPARPEPA